MYFLTLPNWYKFWCFRSILFIPFRLRKFCGQPFSGIFVVCATTNVWMWMTKLSSISMICTNDDGYESKVNERCSHWGMLKSIPLVNDDDMRGGLNNDEESKAICDSIRTMNRKGSSVTCYERQRDGDGGGWETMAYLAPKLCLPTHFIIFGEIIEAVLCAQTHRIFRAAREKTKIIFDVRQTRDGFRPTTAAKKKKHSPYMTLAEA